VSPICGYVLVLLCADRPGHRNAETYHIERQSNVSERGRYETSLGLGLRADTFYIHPDLHDEVRVVDLSWKKVVMRWYAKVNSTSSLAMLPPTIALLEPSLRLLNLLECPA
jgi:hypothetical protein